MQIRSPDRIRYHFPTRPTQPQWRLCFHFGKPTEIFSYQLNRKRFGNSAGLTFRPAFIRFRIFWARAPVAFTSLENTGSTGSPEAKVLLWCNGSTKSADVVKQSNYRLLSVTNVDGRRAYSWPNHREGPTMSTQVNASRYETESVIPFAANTKTVPANELDKAGQTILQLLHRAAGVVENNNRQALETAQKLSHQLRSAEDRIAELEAEVESYRERAERAEQWLHTVYTEIENRFLRNTNSTPTTTSR
jgi:hypothetical protein